MRSLPQELDAFIRRQIDSVGHLEALLLAFRSAGEGWTSEQVARRLYISEPEARAILQQLVDRELLAASDSGFAFVSADEMLTTRVRELEDYYRTHLIPISDLIHSKTPARIREFADAFNFRRKK